MKAYLQRDDPQLLSLAAEPPAAPAARHTEWVKKATKAKSTIILCLGSAPMSLTRLLIDDDAKNAKELWEELNKPCITSSTQMVLNLKQKLDSLYFDDGKVNWEVPVTEFLTICDELSPYDEQLSEKDKINKLIRSLPDSFPSFSFYISTNEVATFEIVKNAVSTELERRGNPRNMNRNGGQHGNGE